MNEVLLLLGMAVVTFLPRYLPIAFSSRLELPDIIVKALQFVPIAVLTVIIVQTSFFQQGQLQFTTHNPFLWGLAAAIVMAYVQKNMLATIVVGMAVFGTARYFIG
jgi:branched-subunit amino acid transport protein